MENISVKENNNAHVCPHQIAFMLDNPIRRFFQNPKKLLEPYIQEGETVMDLGCGPGFFTIDMAKLVGSKGKVIAVDLQDKMLDHVRKKAKKHHIEDRIRFFKCEQGMAGFNQKAGFILAYYMVHEAPSSFQLLKELKNILKDDGKVLIVEPKMHVKKTTFKRMLSEINELGYRICGFPKNMGGHGVLISV